ncbi:DUF1735 domain-containing protein [Pedobacter sp. PF22-3]|uniref:DUF1735 domain-containing protein n=1 Tax=Pedobacter sp. PF22-3 TaxID=2994467 RepID=UPI002247BA96|nr:DUF1735 domain-containing protein [Pedobacter sp. PF22-3]MCX2493487.1 DUF1735 domain-containing protein [Pedobacter sp. PF22-3]
MKIFKLLITGAILTTVMSSCLKNKFDIINPSGSPSVVEFKNPVAPSSETPEGSLYTVFPVAYEVAASVEVAYTVQLTGPDPAPQDVVVNIGVKSAAIAELNADKSVISSYVPYVELPASLYTITTPTVTIPSGQRTAIVKVAYKTGNFDFSKKYALPISITSSNYGGVSKNFGTVLLNVSAKNAYDGIYAMQTGSFVQRYSNPTTPTTGDALNGNTSTNPNVTLTTVGATTLEITNLRWAGGSSNVAGIDNLRLTVDPATNLVTMSSLGNPTLANVPGSVNKYDPATRTFTLNFDWNQTAAKRVYGLNIKYSGVR